LALQYHGTADHPRWEVTLADTGFATEKASRLRRLSSYLEGDRFFVTYGDGVGNIDLDALVAFHKGHGCLATVTSVQVPFQYGILDAGDDDVVREYQQKPLLPYWINAGFMLFERDVLSLIGDDDDVHLEREILPLLVSRRQLMRYRHTGFWRSMDTLKDTMVLEEMWQERAPWKVW
jgi:glucose-1-phosphate cytidylyltransferase